MLSSVYFLFVLIPLVLTLAFVHIRNQGLIKRGGGRWIGWLAIEIAHWPSEKVSGLVRKPSPGEIIFQKAPSHRDYCHKSSDCAISQSDCATRNLAGTKM